MPPSNWLFGTSETSPQRDRQVPEGVSRIPNEFVGSERIKTGIKEKKKKGLLDDHEVYGCV